MNKFQKLIGDNTSETLSRRAKTISAQTEIAQQNLINELKKKIAAKELRLEDLTDLAPDTTDSLRPGCKDFNPDGWADEMQNLKFDLWQLNQELALAEETYKEYFTEEKETVEVKDN